MTRSWTCALLVMLATASPGAFQRGRPKDPPLRPIAPLNLGAALDAYAAGRFDEAVGAVAKAGNEVGRNLRRHWAVTGQQWIDAEPARRPQRLLAAAALALETEHLRAEHGDWRFSSDNPACAAACVLDWAQLRLAERGAADAAEHAWYLAAAALAGGVRDWRYLQRMPEALRSGRVVAGLMDRALQRFPADAALRLEQAVAAAGRFNVVTDGARLAPVFSLPIVIVRGSFPTERIGDGGAGPAAAMLAALADDPAVGAEATLRLGYLEWVLERDAAARTHLTAAAAESRDADVRYLAHFLLGWIAIKAGDNAGAIPLLEAALADRPDSQSAAVALAALELQRGDAGKAHEIARGTLDRRAQDLDPWRLFLYGHHPSLAARIADLRREIR